MLKRRKRSNAPITMCIAPKCGRHSYARGLCQTHHRQMLRTGERKPIRPYRPRQPGTVKFAGLRLSKRCATMLGRYATQRDFSLGAAVADLLEDALVKKKPRRSREDRTQ
jgi:hypothetical protein